MKVNPYQQPIPVADRILEYLQYHGDPRRPSAPKLSERDKEIWVRWQAILSKILKEGLSWADAKAVVCRTFNISEATYWRDVRGVSSIYPDVVEVNREMRKIQYREMAQKAWQIAAKKGDAKAMSSALKNLISLDGFDRDVPDKIDAEKLNPGLYTIVLDDNTREMLRLLRKQSSVIDLTKLAREAEEIEHEEIPNTGGANQIGN